MEKDKWHYIGRGFNGWHAQGIDISSSGGEYNGYLAEAIDGALIYDAAHLSDIPEAAEAFAHMVISGPMLDPSLPSDGVNSFSSSDRRVALEMSPVLGGAFKTYALLAQYEKFSGLDCVGIGVFEGLLCKIPGIKIGHVYNGEVVWKK